MNPSDGLKPADLISFGGTIFRGHFEYHSIPIAKAMINVANVVHFRAFDPQAKELPQLRYALFGRGEELFAAHYIIRPPDFDQVLSVKIMDHKFTDEELSHGVSITFPERANTIPMKIKEGERISGEARTADTANPLKVSLEAGTQLYFCADELSKAMTRPT